MRADIDFVVEIFSKLSEPTTEERIRNGQRLRAKILQALEKGEVPEGYRWAWIKSSANQLMELLQMMADDFNKAHPDDMITFIDLLDIVSVADKQLRSTLDKKD